MNLPRSRTMGVAMSAAVVAAAAGITLGVTTLLGVTFGGGGAEADPGAKLVEGLLRTPNRDRLAICVEVVGSGPDIETRGGEATVERDAKSSIEAALVKAREHPYWEPAGLGDLSPVVDIGCPSDPPSAVDYDWRYPIESIEGRLVEDPSYYHTFVFILPQEELEELTGGSDQRATNQEIVLISSGGEPTPGEFSDAVFSTVTGGLYIAPDELADIEFLTDRLERAIGLREGL